MSSDSTPRTGRLDINGASLAYERAGTGHPLVLLHAGICDRRMWDAQMPAFAAQYQVLRYDLRGFGESTVPDGPFAHRDDLYGLLRALGIARAHVLGVSMGGSAALDFALEHPEMVSALVLVASGMSGYVAQDVPPIDYSAIEAADREGDLALINELEMRLWVDGPQRTPDQVDPAVRAKVLAMNGHTLTHENEAAIPQPLQPPAVGRLHEVRVPTLLVEGDGDVPNVLATMNALAAGIAGARRAVFHGAAHLPSMEQPEEFNRIVLEFLASVR